MLRQERNKELAAGSPVGLISFSDLTEKDRKCHVQPSLQSVICNSSPTRVGEIACILSKPEPYNFITSLGVL